MQTRTRRGAPRAVLIPLCLVLAAASVAGAQQRESAPHERSDDVLMEERYVRPPADIERLVTAPRQQNITLTNQSPDHRYFVNLRSGGLPSLDRFGKPHLYLGGLQVDFRANRARTLTTRGAEALVITDVTTARSRTIEAPAGASISSPAWSPDGDSVAFIANFDDASRLYVADAATGRSRRVTAAPLLATLVTDIRWTGDGRSLVAVLVPDGRKPAPMQPAIETGPLVRITDAERNPTRTYASLLRDPTEKAQLEYYSTGQLATVDVASGAVRKVGAPAMITDVDPSPDGKYFRVRVMQEPFSYIVQYTSFGQSEQLWSGDGRVIAVLATQPARLGDVRTDDQAAGGSAADTVRRDFGWMPDGNGLYFLQQDPAPAATGSDSAVGGAVSGDGAPVGQASRAARRKDRLYRWVAPFDATSRKVLLESDNRIGSVLFSDDASMAFVAENASGTGHVYATYFNEPGKRYTIWRMRGLTASVGGARRGSGGGRGGTGADSLTFYLNPGEPMSRRGRLGGQVAILSPDGGSAYLMGTRYARVWQDSAPRGFLDRVEVRTGKKTRLFESAPDVFETVTAALDDEMRRVVVSRESPTVVPDGYVRDLQDGTLTKLTDNRDYTPEFTNLVRKKVGVTRVDGTRFIVDLTLPRDYRAGTRLPGMLWFYPYEYTDQASYDRTLRTENVNEFPSSGPRTIEYLATQGYAVVNFSPPILGERGRMNDNYVSDLRNNLDAVINELDRQGYIDRTRLGIGGHSYGAFSAVNAMVHTPYFRAGIAGDGMYNRSLTPNGFQSERRDFWEGQRTYLEMSPFFYADRMTGALLMYHSIEDQNVGTAPISSIRMMHALESLGKTASLYMYPYEDHGPAARETILDQWARWVAWLDRYVKNPEVQPTPGKVAAEGK
jgi:dipeptidyl aminopeptidase/acylaminoacyl peptidase